MSWVAAMAIEWGPDDYGNGTGADRQLKVFEESNHDLKAVVDYMARETAEGL
jgi:hypothetical protein